jgi:peptidoglycan hydrolase-like protein with peptidoglycan-binding domain
MSMKTKILFLVAFLLLVLGAASAQAEAVKCVFDRDLELGSQGEDVRCLQKFLNGAGFVIAEGGVGSPGSETTIFREKTKEALKRWQAAQGVTPATGYFGTLSRAAYSIQSTGATPAPTPAPVVITPVEDPNLALSRQVRSLLKKVRQAVEKAEEDIDEAEDDGENVTSPRKFYDKAEDKLLQALYAFLDENYTSATSLANSALEYAGDSTEDIKGSKDDAEEAIDDAEAALDDAADEIDDADDDGDDVDEAEDLLDDAEDKLADARDAFDDEDYNEAKELAEDAEDLADRAVDAIGN